MVATWSSETSADFNRLHGDSSAILHGVYRTSKARRLITDQWQDIHVPQDDEYDEEQSTK
jgi:hypothetical protein